MPSEPEFLVIGEASELIRTPVATLHQWAYRHIGPPVRRVGRRLLYKRTELLAWLDEQLTTDGEAMSIDPNIDGGAA